MGPKSITTYIFITPSKYHESNVLGLKIASEEVRLRLFYAEVERRKVKQFLIIQMFHIQLFTLRGCSLASVSSEYVVGLRTYYFEGYS